MTMSLQRGQAQPPLATPRSAHTAVPSVLTTLREVGAQQVVLGWL